MKGSGPKERGGIAESLPASAREEKRYGLRVCYKGFSVSQQQLLFFSFHHRIIKDQEKSAKAGNNQYPCPAIRTPRAIKKDPK